MTASTGFLFWIFGSRRKAETVAGFDRQIAGATDKCWLKSGSPGNRKPFSETTLTRREIHELASQDLPAIASLTLT